MYMKFYLLASHFCQFMASIIVLSCPFTRLVKNVKYVKSHALSQESLAALIIALDAATQVHKSVAQEKYWFNCDC